jgi:uncharacterized Ntn-hydrolase superfamily protein
MRVRPSSIHSACLLATFLLAAAPAGATWSIVAVDPETREVGVAGASCIVGAEVLAKLVPGHGAVAAQAIPNLAARDELAALVARGESPFAAIEAVTGSGFDEVLGVPAVALRQYGVAALGFENDPANYTGSWTMSWSGARTGFGVTVQGNMLRGAKVVEDALWAFEEEKRGCTRRLSDRLMDALEAGARAGGDRRCTPELAALSAFLFVAKPDDAPDAPSLSLVRNRPGSQLRNPWRDLRRSLLLTREKGEAAENPVFLLRGAYRAQEGEAPGCE